MSGRTTMAKPEAACWLTVPCPDCGAVAGEQCFAVSSFAGKVDCPLHQERVLAVIRSRPSLGSEPEQ